MDMTNICNIKVVGVGGGGNKAVNRMISAGVGGVYFVAVNTDKQDLMMSNADEIIQIGKQITKAVLTTLILSGIVCLLNYLGCSVISIAAAALMAYIPFVLILIALWYVVYRIF